jgi:SWI/SNF-related matrix-associated actin-dependent regulator of chromatin subfamily D
MRSVRCVSSLTSTLSFSHKKKKVFGTESIPFQKLPELVNRYLTTPDPVILHYTIDPSQSPPERHQVWDIEVKTEDALLKGRMTSMVQASKESSVGLSKMDEEVFCFALPLFSSS